MQHRNLILIADIKSKILLSMKLRFIFPRTFINIANKFFLRKILLSLQVR